jgi:hypothetical protein
MPSWRKSYDLLFGREWPFFVAFDLLAVDGEELTSQPLLERTLVRDTQPSGIGWNNEIHPVSSIKVQ